MILRPQKRRPDFRQLAKVLDKKKPDRPVLFELFVCDEIIEQVTEKTLKGKSDFERNCAVVETYDRLGYDYSLVATSGLKFKTGQIEAKASFSLNDGAVITDRASFDKYPWPDAKDFEYSHLDRLKNEMPEGMGLLVWSNDGPLESVIRLVGYENLCYMLYDDEELVADIFEQVGKRTYEDYKKALERKAVDGLVVGDDWGFNTQTLLPADVYRKYLFPWHKKIVALAHESGRQAILHSCGRYDSVIEDIIEDIGYDARHSYEDNIVPVEKAYEQLSPRIAVLGGIDVNFLATAPVEEIVKRAKNLLTMTMDKGGYALGSGNSIPAYVPADHYYAMIQTALKMN
ncbi:MAG: hypothetical protein MRZ59_04665 [Clostridiales bacterium]|nr:hypothetical protein [Clostridiales bacterium]MDY3747691.1 uroporphyrinogen decarboxylase family protein [Lachnospiraceae bacterium]